MLSLVVKKVIVMHIMGVKNLYDILPKMFALSHWHLSKKIIIILNFFIYYYVKVYVRNFKKNHFQKF